MGLADAGGPVDEERVVGVAGELGHGQRGGMGEAVGVADDELLEREVRVDPVSCSGTAWVGLGRGGRAPRAGGRSRRAERTSTVASGPRTAATAACSTRAKRSATQARSSRGASTTRTSPSSPTARSGREPEVVHVRRDRLAQLVLDGAPDVVGVLGHGRGSRLLDRQRSAADGGGGRPGGDRRRRL